jgi:bacterioferritin
MTGKVKVQNVLNALLADELTAINQYMVHSEMCDNWGFEALHKAIEKRAIDEMRHAESLITRILFLEGSPTVSKLNAISIGKTVKEMIANDTKAESDAIAAYNEGITIAGSEGDYGTRELLQTILKDEEAHIDWLEAQRDQIEQMGMENYLAHKA